MKLGQSLVGQTTVKWVKVQVKFFCALGPPGHDALVFIEIRRYIRKFMTDKLIFGVQVERKSTAKAVG